ncbi:MAG: hypothetical protein ACI8S6_002499 [Myxococcota bacterium]|jgi:hypothetical protein
MAGEKRVVIGRGPDALRAAATLAADGQPVTLLQQGPGDSGLRHPHLPNGTGWMRTPGDDREQVEAVLGPTVDAPDPLRAVMRRGHRYTLPLQRWQIGRLLERHARLPAAREWLRARSRNTTADLTGTGQEERSYEDWVTRRMGGPAYHHLYRDYAQRRWGWDPADLSASLARVHHAIPDPGPFQVAGGGYDEVLVTAAQVIRAAGGEIISDASIRGLDLTDGRVSAVRTDDGTIAVSGQVFIAADGPTLLGWMGEGASTSMHVDASFLPMRDVAVVALRGEVDGLPDELHVLDGRAPFWRVIVPYGIEKTALFHVTLPEGHQDDDAALTDQVLRAASEIGLTTFSGVEARVERLWAWQPVWRRNSHARLRRLLRALRPTGVVWVGRGGAFDDVDPATEIRLAAAYVGDPDPDQAEVHRVLLDPPVRHEDLSARITRLVER